MDECLAVPCRAGATCIDLVADYKCECEPGWQGRNCDQV